MKPLYCEETAWLAKIRQRKSLELKAAGNPDFDFSFFIQTRQKARVIGSSLVIDVIGPLYGDGVPLNEVLGGTNYQSIVKEIKGAAGNIDEVVFIFDSPGGDVQGCHETAELIKSLPVETVAYVKGMCCPAAYYLASACDQVVVTETALVGSIGTVISLWNAKSEEILTITNDDAVFKHPETPMNTEAIAYYRDLCNKIAGRFQEFVASGRPGLSADAFSGKVFVAEDAVSLGLIDDVIPWVDFPGVV